MPYPTLKGALARFAATVLPSRKPAARAFQSPPWQFDASRWSLELLKRLEWRRLEELAVAYFEALGSATRVCDPGDGGGADILVQAAEENAMLVRCKAWNAYGIGIKPLLDMQAVMAARGIARGMMLSAGKFTAEARGFAVGQGIELVDGPAFLGRLAALAPEKSLALLRFATEGDFLTPTCPACAIKMVARQSTQGGRRFWGCRNYPRCKQIVYPTAHAPA